MCSGKYVAVTIGPIMMQNADQVNAAVICRRAGDVTCCQGAVVSQGQSYSGTLMLICTLFAGYTNLFGDA
jgi:hypothetical protein